jgi:hypothetical protein
MADIVGSSAPGANYTFAFHDGDEVGPRLVAQIAQKTGLQPDVGGVKGRFIGSNASTRASRVNRTIGPARSRCRRRLPDRPEWKNAASMVSDDHLLASDRMTPLLMAAGMPTSSTGLAQDFDYLVRGERGRCAFTQPSPRMSLASSGRWRSAGSR